MTLTQMGEKFGKNFTLPPPPAGQTPEQRVQWALNEQTALGRTPAGWTAMAKSLPALATLGAPSSLPSADLATEVIALDRLAGAKVSAADKAAIVRQAGALPATIKAPLTQLVATMRAAYATQIPIAQVVNARVAAIKTFDGTGVLTTAERDVMLASQQSIVGALGSFRTATAGHLADFRSSGRTFADPASLVIVGSSGDDTYNRSASMFPDPILLVDPEGSDTYLTSAGGACPVAPEGNLPPPFVVGGHMMDCNNLVLSVTADLSQTSNDSYSFDGAPAPIQGGAGPGAIGVLVDLGGNDSYTTTMTRGNVPTFPTTYWDGGSQGFGYGGVGVLIDAAGDDRYDARVKSDFGFDASDLAQGFGGGGGVGLAVDAAGNDQWLTEGLGLTGRRGFEGIYANGTSLFGGLGLQEEMAGDDYYYSSVHAETTDYYSVGFGAFGGVGILDEVAGNDRYFTQEVSDNPFINPLLNCAYGTGSFAGVGIMVDHAGNDYYEGDTSSPTGAHVMDWGWGGPGAALGVFVDLGGDDVYYEHAESTNGQIYYGGYGYYEPVVPDVNNLGNYDPVDSPAGQNVFGVFVDIGGTDVYDSPHDADVKNDSVWPFGVDHA